MRTLVSLVASELLYNNNLHNKHWRKIFHLAQLLGFSNVEKRNISVFLSICIACLIDQPSEIWVRTSQLATNTNNPIFIMNTRESWVQPACQCSVEYYHRNMVICTRVQSGRNTQNTWRNRRSNHRIGGIIMTYSRTSILVSNRELLCAGVESLLVHFALLYLSPFSGWLRCYFDLLIKKIECGILCTKCAEVFFIFKV